MFEKFMFDDQEKNVFAPPPKEGEPYDVAIIGSGPSALTAAIYTTRGAASTLILGGGNWGGQLMLTTAVDNFPGFPEGIQGPELMNSMKSQAERFGANFKTIDVEFVDFDKVPFEMLADGQKYLARTVIVATGAETKWLGVPGEEKLRGRGVSSCAPCDAPFFKNKKVAVIGGGDAAMEEALVLTKYASEVTIIHRKAEFKASAAMQKRVMDNKNIQIKWNSEVTEFMGEQKLERLKVRNVESGEIKEMEIDGAFVAIGHHPSTDIFKGLLDLDEKGFVKRYEDIEFKSMTNIKGVFVAGDVHDHIYKQAITASGFGCMAGMDVLKYLDKNTPNW
jgi:thioredoxin reductase (NADPH)